MQTETNCRAFIFIRKQYLRTFVFFYSDSSTNPQALNYCDTPSKRLSLSILTKSIFFISILIEESPDTGHA